MSAEWSRSFSNPVRRTAKQEAEVRAARSESNFFDITSGVIDFLMQRYPDQVRSGVAAIAARQWVELHSARRGDEESDSRDAALRAFERWKARIRELDLEIDSSSVDESAFVVLDDMDRVLPVFLIDTTAVEEGRQRSRARIDELEGAFGRVRRDMTAEDVADELGTTPHTVWAWAHEGMPFTRSRVGKGRPMFFNWDEVKNWIRQYGSDKAKGMLAALITPEELNKAISESSSLAEARTKLGLSDFLFRGLRRSLGVHVPIPTTERPHAWGALGPEELAEVIERHEGRREPIAEELGFSLWELRRAIEHHGLLEHPFVLRPRSVYGHRPFSFTKEQLEGSITKHVGRRDEIAADLGVSRGLLREAIISFDLLDHPMLQAGRVPARVTRSLEEKTTSGAGRGGLGVRGARARGHEHGFAREATVVPFWLAAIREVMARHPGRGGGRATAAEIGVSPVTLTNVIQGKRVPGYEVMGQIMRAAGRPIPDWHAALLELIDNRRSEVERLRGIGLPSRALDEVSTLLGIAPMTVSGLHRGTKAPSMVTIQKILEATGRPYLVESIETPETIAYGGPAEPPKVAEWRRAVAAEILRTYMFSGLPWTKAAKEVGGAEESSVLAWSRQAREGFGPFVEAAQEDPSLLPLPPHLREGAPEPGRGVKYGPWRPSP